MKKLIKDKLIWIVVLIAIVGRIAMTPLGFHGDIITQAGWGKWIYENGMKGFYENDVWIYGWPNHPPIVSMSYGLGFYIYQKLNTAIVVSGNFIALNHLGAGHMPWLYEFAEWWGNAKYIDTPFKIGELISMKLLPIIGDGILAYLIFRIIKKMKNEKTGKLAAILYLFSPFSWYESGLWGQNDQLGLIFLLLAFLTLTSKKQVWMAPLLMAISIMVKPTAFVYGLLFAWVAIRDRETFKKVVLGGILTAGGYFLLTTLISPNNFINFNLNLQKQMFVKGEYWTWVNTFNFWRLITPYLTDYRQTILGINLRIWGFLSFIILNLAVFWHYQKRNWDEVLKAIFIIAFGGWMTMTAMHERYLFPAVVTGLILALKNQKLMKYWVVMSLIFSVNLYNGWWFPENFGWLKNILTWGSYYDGLIPRILAGINTFLIIVMVKKIWTEKNKKQLMVSD